MMARELRKMQIIYRFKSKVAFNHNIRFNLLRRMKSGIHDDGLVLNKKEMC
jgi:hypothetical protein